MLLNHVFYAGLILLGGVNVDVKPLTGITFQAEWVGIENGAVVIVQDGQPQQLPVAGLWEITPVAPADAPASLITIWVELIDGSQLLATRYRVSDGLANIKLTGGEEIEVRTRSIRTVRFRDHSTAPVLAKQWQEIAQQKHSGDVIVIRRQESLDHLDGALANVSDETVSFEFDGDKIEVNRQKLDGLVYYHPIARQLPDRICQLIDVSGTRWSVQSLTLADGKIELTSPAGAKLTVPVERLGKLDFSSGNTVWLSDLEPEFVQRRPYVASRLPQPSLERLFQPRRDLGMTGKPLMLDGVTYKKGIAMISRTEMVFRLTEDFRNFHAMVGIDDAVRDGGNVELVISGDDRVLLTQTVTGRDKAFPVDLDITGVRRLKILVDFGEEMDIADHLNLCDARLTK
jgi:hypothetical protein